MIIMWAAIAIVTSRRVQTGFGTIGPRPAGYPGRVLSNLYMYTGFFSSVQFRHPLSMA